MRGFVQLYKKDLESISLMTIVLAVGILLWDAYFYTRIGIWKVEVAIIPTLLPFGVIGFWLLFQAIQVYRHEWQTGGIQLLLALPQPGVKIALAKLAAVMTSFTLHLVVAILGFVWVLWAGSHYSPDVWLFNMAVATVFQSRGALSWLIKILAGAGLAYWLVGLANVVILQLAYNYSRLTTRLRFLVGLASFLVSQWVMTLCGAFGYKAFSWVPNLIIRVHLDPDAVRGIESIHGMAQAPVQMARVTIDSGILLGNALGVVLMFVVISYFLQDVMEA